MEKGPEEYISNTSCNFEPADDRLSFCFGFCEIWFLASDNGELLAFKKSTVNALNLRFDDEHTGRFQGRK